jgi:hypothetical protein
VLNEFTLALNPFLLRRGRRATGASTTFFFHLINSKVAMKKKSRNSAKRREAKKRERSIKRKAQVRLKSFDNMQTQQPLEYAFTRKLSEVVLEFAEPLTDAVENTESEGRAIELSVLLWNASLLPKQKALGSIQPALEEIADGDQALVSEFHGIFEMMYARKQSHYATDKRFIVDYSLEKNAEGYFLQVASSPVQN